MPYVCLMQDSCYSLPRLLEKAQHNKFSVVAAPINAMEVPLEFEAEPMHSQLSEFTYPDSLITSEQWSTKFISILTDDIECDSENPKIRRHSEEKLMRDLAWVSHVQPNGHTMLRLRHGKNHNLARLATNKTKGFLLVQVPLYNRKLAQSQWRQDVNEEDMLTYEKEDTWQWWNEFRRAADYFSRVKVVCELNECNVPSRDEIRRWLGEPVEAIIIPGTMFIQNKHNCSVLPKVWQEVVAHFMRARVNLILSLCVDDHDLKNKSEYLINLRDHYIDNHPLQGWEDVLEIPLQPLYDNLDCDTYEIFEKDPVKYKYYQDAVEAALIDRVPEADVETRVTIVMVLGAGRGPLVRSCLNAAENTKRKIKVYVIEKNPNAIRTLTNMMRKLWHNKDVHIFSKDMREFQPPEKADIIVSELLGSFGDNELSPECLDSSLALLKPDGISIPCKSTSFINPIMSSKLYNAVRQISRHDQFGRDKLATYSTHAESGYVVLLKNIFNIGHPQALFEFVHPNNEKPIDNSRFKKLSFEVTIDCVLNGIAGYFEAVLYKDIILSINPSTHTPGMISWFPMYFPFTEPVELKQGQTVEIHFWRCVTKQKIWYEWCLSSPTTTHIHNQNGRSCPIYC